MRHKKDEETHSSSGGPYVCVPVYNELKKQHKALSDALELVKETCNEQIREIAELHTKLQNLRKHIHTAETTDIELNKIRDRLDLLEGLSWKKPVTTYNPVVIGAGGGGSAEAVTGSNGQHPPTHPPEQLFPADLTPGTYVAMDEDGEWYNFMEEPTVRIGVGVWIPSNSSGPPVCNYIADETLFMKSYNRQSWTSSLHIIGKK